MDDLSLYFIRELAKLRFWKYSLISNSSVATEKKSTFFNSFAISRSFVRFFKMIFGDIIFLNYFFVYFEMSSISNSLKNAWTSSFRLGQLNFS